jgi:hypothetical protein
MDQKQFANVEYLNSSSNLITDDVKYASEIKSRIVMAQVAIQQEKDFFPLNKQIRLKFRKKLVRGYILSIALYGAGEGWRRSVELTLR